MSTSKTKLDAGLVRELAAILREADLGEVEVKNVARPIRVFRVRDAANSATKPKSFFATKWRLPFCSFLSCRGGPDNRHLGTGILARWRAFILVEY